ncbi:radical SAM protein, partial [Candidatus Woesearchaeota archaeon]|nr:radical SAM protein [Candidatus Woesearchaeota archaeon]
IPSHGRIHRIDLTLLQELSNVKRFSESGGGSILESVSEKGFAAYLEMQRGCNRACDFCYAAKTPFDRLSVDEIKQQIDYFVESGVSMIMFTDDNTMLKKPAELEEIFAYLRNRGVAWEFPNGLEFGLFGTVDKSSGIWQPKKTLLDALFYNNGDRANYAGVHRLLFPVEDSLLRGSSLAKLRNANQIQALDAILEREVPFVNIGIMIGAATESQEERNNLLHRMEELHQVTRRSTTTVNYSLFCTMPLPGTVLGRQMHADGRVKYDINEYPELWNVFTSVLQGDNFTAEETTRFRHDILSRYSMEQDEGKVSPRIPTDTIDMKKSPIPEIYSTVGDVARDIASVGLTSLERETELIKLGNITQIPPFVFSGPVDSSYNGYYFIEKASERSTEEIRNRFGDTALFLESLF